MQRYKALTHSVSLDSRQTRGSWETTSALRER